MCKNKNSEFKSVADVSQELNVPVDGFSSMLGIYVKEKSKQKARIGVHIKPHYRNPLGAAHGGLLATLVDMAAGLAANSEGEIGTTLSMNINYMRASTQSDTLEATATALHSGRSTSVYSVSIKETDGKQIASATVTYFMFGKKWSESSTT
ncbi:MAG TPA: PaaI family thioesterase [Clostridiaceae bacterium]|nr:PaaI family thioesterase [Clostridiaceae bacterium]